MNLQPERQNQLLDIFHEIIRGKGTHCEKLSLLLDGIDVTGLFAEELIRHGFEQCRVGDVHLDPGERVPAFVLRESTAYFGWVFWEKFSAGSMRKLWGSIHKNRKGDWSIQLSEKSRVAIYANQRHRTAMEIDLVR